MDFNMVDNMNMEIDNARRMWGSGLITNDEYTKKLFVILSKYIEFVEEFQGD